jgi:hypothetical protein
MANADLTLDDTQHMFDTQFAAAGIESQISALSSDDSFPFPTTELISTAKRRRQLEERSPHSSKRLRPNIDPASTTSLTNASVYSLATQTSSQDRRDSQSAEVPSPVERPRTGTSAVQNATPIDQDMQERIDLQKNDSPSTAMEREIEAYSLLRNKRPEPIREPLRHVGQLEEMISSLLQDSYGLSKSDDGLTDGDAVLSGCPHEVEEQLDFTNLRNITQNVENILNNHERIQVDDEGEGALSKEQATVENEDTIYVLNEHPQHPEQPIDNQDFALNLGQHDDFSNPLPNKAESHRLITLAVPKRTKPPPPKKRTSLLRKPPIASLHANHFEDCATTEEKGAHYNRRFPCHFFPKPSSTSARPGQDDTTHAQSISSPKPLDAMMAERHMLYRRKMHRELSAIERGYWSVDISSWTTEVQSDFLVDLRAQIENRVLTDMSWVDISHDTSGSPSTVELYCGVAELGEAWLLLMVLSERRIASQDLNWVGWDGQPAVTMPSKNAAITTF